MLQNDSVTLDSLSIIPGSLLLQYKTGGNIDTSFYSVDYIHSLLIIKKPEAVLMDSLKVSYKVFPYSFGTTYKHKESSLMVSGTKNKSNPFRPTSKSSSEDIFAFEGLNKNGSISRGITIGSNQDATVSSNLDLQLSGKIQDDVEISAVISDNNIPIQPEGNTQQLQEFDKVYIQLSRKSAKLIAGDFILQKPAGELMDFYKRAQGLSLASAWNVKPKTAKDTLGTYKVQASVARSKGKFARNTITGIEGNQGPYKLKGNDNESYIIVLSGTEVVYIDGRLLKRGQKDDYVIDYNTGEITFTSNMLITKDSRIIVEFQYSINNYARTLFYTSNEWESKRTKIHLNIYSEQDLKNQPLQGDLTDEQKQLLANVGDSVQNAYLGSIDSIGYATDKVMYKMIDTLGYDSVLVYSTNADSAIYTASFALVGAGNGNYNHISSSANGKVFEWVAPVAGIPQGSYEPILILITPNKTQMITLGGEIKMNKNTLLQTEVALSNKNNNEFSSLHKEDDAGYAVQTKIQNIKKLSKDTIAPWILSSSVAYQLLGRTFSPIERILSTEFERDWNIANTNYRQNQHIANIGLLFSKKQLGSFNYQCKTLLFENAYQGLQNYINTTLRKKEYTLDFKGSLMQSKDSINTTEFLKLLANLSKNIKKTVIIGVIGEVEHNSRININTDSLLSSSFYYNQWQAYVKTPEDKNNRCALKYIQRTDYAPYGLSFKAKELAQNINLETGLTKNKYQTVSSNITYRKLSILDTSLSIQNADFSLLSRLDYGLRLAKGAISSKAYYEIGSGMEAKLEFSFVEVAAGTGSYTWNDYNENGVQELNEFEISIFQDQANYIKVYTPTTEYVKTFTNLFNEVLSLTPSAIWHNEKGIKKLVSRFSNQTTFRIDRKTNKESIVSAYNPFLTNLVDSNLMALNSSFRNIFYFNRSSSKFESSFSYTDNRNKILLSNGFDSKLLIEKEFRIRWNMTKTFTLNVSATQGEKGKFSEYFSTQDYDINYYEANPQLSYQPGVKFRASLIYKYQQKQNEPLYGSQLALVNDIGIEIRYNVVSKGNLLLKANYIDIQYNDTESTSLSFEMLNGLSIGKNATWSIGYQRTLMENMQLNLLYDGRTSANGKLVHTGNVQVRAYF